MSTHIDTASTAERLVLKCACFQTSDEVAVAIKEGVATKLKGAVMTALRSCFESLSNRDICILVDLYTTAPSAETTTADTVMEPEDLNILAKQEHDPPRLPLEAGVDDTQEDRCIQGFFLNAGYL